MAHRSEGRNLQDVRTLAEALRLALHDSGKSTDTVAERLGIRRAYLTEALNEERDETQFQARKIVGFCAITDSVLPIAWMADQLGYVLVQREHAVTADSVMRETLDVAASAGRLSHRVREATSDGRICPIEGSDIVAEARRVQRDAAQVERAVEVIAAEPARRRA